MIKLNLYKKRNGRMNWLKTMVQHQTSASVVISTNQKIQDEDELFAKRVIKQGAWGFLGK